MTAAILVWAEKVAKREQCHVRVGRNAADTVGSSIVLGSRSIQPLKLLNFKDVSLKFKIIVKLTEATKILRMIGLPRAVTLCSRAFQGSKRFYALE